MKPRKGQFNFTKTIKVNAYDSGDGQTDIKARHLGRTIGKMTLEAPFSDPKREVAEVSVNKKYRKQGIATAMWEHAKTTGLKPKHSETQTPSGRAWAKKVGD